MSAVVLSLQAGIILCCLGCAIFGITEVPTDGVEFDSGDEETGHSWNFPQTDPPPVPVPQSQPTSSTANHYSPPSQENANAAGGWDPEKGEARKSFIGDNRPPQSPAVVIPESKPAEQTQQQQAKDPVDLLDPKISGTTASKAGANGASFDLD